MQDRFQRSRIDFIVTLNHLRYNASLRPRRGGGTVGPEARNQTWHSHCRLCTMYCCTSVRFLPLRCQVTHLYNRHSPCGI